MSAYLRAKNWKETFIGIPVNWSQNLKTTLSILLGTKLPMLLWWGPQFLCFYNDAYKPILGENDKHPLFIGMPAEEVMVEVWNIVKPIIDQVVQNRFTITVLDQLIYIYKNGKLQDVYLTLNYSSVADEEGKVGGILVTSSICTNNILRPLRAHTITTDARIGIFKDKSGQKPIINTFNNRDGKFRNAVLQVPVGIIVLRGTKFYVKMANYAYLEIIDQREQDFVGKPIFDSLPESRATVESLLTNVYKSGTPFNTLEHPVPLNKFGKILIGYFNFSYNVLGKESGNISGIIVIANKVTHMVKKKQSFLE